ncbi:hypothetical protein CDL12_14025 [Handroanthus impetiginosus]|uniref:Uncharacterized protein n=1 Tax=Handroanthus impetiginosus TaxID=429701 RepID=A0A2G9H771_9LAMI|nr:hypothetical protein CDL12_14025 [Handroanthus impetiginosus]
MLILRCRKTHLIGVKLPFIYVQKWLLMKRPLRLRKLCNIICCFCKLSCIVCGVMIVWYFCVIQSFTIELVLFKHTYYLHREGLKGKLDSTKNYGKFVTVNVRYLAESLLSHASER